MTHQKFSIQSVLMLIITFPFFLSPSLTWGQTPEKIVLKSHTPQDYSDIMSGRYRQSPIDIQGFLALPVGQGKFPAVVIIPGSGGYQQWMQDSIAKRLNDAGIATLIVDSFTSRGVNQTATNQGTVPMAASVIDGFAALRALSERPEIDASRVGITGFSRGAVAAMFAQDRRLVEAASTTPLQFAAHLPIYPGCATTFDKPMPTTSPSLFLMGEKDDYTPASQCVSYIDRLKNAGAQVSSKVYKNAHHGWMSDSREVVYLPSIQVYSKCDMRIDDAGIIRETESGAVSTDGWSAFLTKVWRSCGKYGANYGANEIAKNESLKDMLIFFESVLKTRP